MNVADWLTPAGWAVPSALAIAVATLAALLQSALGLSLFVPGEAVVILSAATLGTLAAGVAMAVAVAVGMFAGDCLGYRVGRRLRSQGASSSVGDRVGASNWQRALDLIEQRGPVAVFLTRLVPVVRTLGPASAGATGVPFARFARASLLFSASWAVVNVGFGVLVRLSLPVARHYLGVSGWLVLTAIAVVGALLVLALALLTRRHRDVEARRTVLGASSLAGTATPAGGHTASLRERLFRQDEWRTLPNAISAARILLLPVFAGLLIAHHFRSAIVVLVIVFVSDFVDGFIARRFHQTSVLGAWLDPVADRLTVVVVVIAFVLAGIVPWPLVAILLIPDVLSGAWAVTAFNGAPDVRVALVGKVRTALLFVGLSMMLIGEAFRFVHPAFVGVGFLLFALGVVGHYAAMTHNSRGLLTLWQDRVQPVR